jgi:hypothetical protein
MSASASGQFQVVSHSFFSHSADRASATLHAATFGLTP